MVMDFREHQDLARRNSRRIWIAYIVLLLLTAFAIAFLAMTLFYTGEVLVASGSEQLGIMQALQMGVSDVFATDHGLVGLAWITGIGIIALGLSSLYGWVHHSDGHKVARAFDGRLITEDTDNSPAEQQALNIVHELSLAASIPTPALYVIPDPAINAFAAGKDNRHAVVAVTEGSLANFNRDELSGVIAHELAHIANEDIKLNIRVAAFVMAFTALFFIARMMFRSALYSRGRGKQKAALIVLAIGLMIIGSLSVLAGRLLQSMMSKQREFLADATAVQYTRYPKGLADALSLIKRGGRSTQINNPEAAEFSHAFIFGKRNLFGTHPPLEERIRRIRARTSDQEQTATQEKAVAK
ncbi:MAG TPA: peptidase M48 [Halothiobacillaceae bacterium]|nr:peptidase M48 [Halothiobacillaceae bacterium]